MPVRGPVFTSILFAATLMLAAGSLRAQVETERAFLLVAKRGMLDANFAETVVLVVRPEDGSPVGVILNRQSTVELRSLYPDRANIADRRDLVFLGGPVEPDVLLFAFRSPRKPLKGLFVADDIYISGFSEVLTEILAHPENAGQQRFFIGFSAWVAGQLENEIAQGGWHVLRFEAGAVFDMNPLTMYQELLERVAVPRIEAARGIHLARAIAR